jgi:hypothetical protein
MRDLLIFLSTPILPQVLSERRAEETVLKIEEGKLSQLDDI